MIVRSRGIVGKKRPPIPVRIVTQCGEYRWSPERGWRPRGPVPWWKWFTLAVVVIVGVVIVGALIWAYVAI